MSAATIIRPSRETDVAAIAAIYGHHVRHGLASFEEVPPAVEEVARRRAEIVGRGLPYLIAECDGSVAGYCYASLFRPRSAYRFTLEDSIYIDPALTGRGIGRALLQAVLQQSEALGYRQMVAVIGGSETVPSIGLHRALGFANVGMLPAVGFKFGRWVDIVLMQRPLGAGAEGPPE
ncbi:MAG: N-acetyltransferase family protein [Thiohalocapsa sp.]